MKLSLMIGAVLVMALSQPLGGQAVLSDADGRLGDLRGSIILNVQSINSTNIEITFFGKENEEYGDLALAFGGEADAALGNYVARMIDMLVRTEPRDTVAARIGNTVLDSAVGDTRRNIAMLQILLD